MEKKKEVTDTVSKASVQDPSPVEGQAVIAGQNADETLRFLEEHEQWIEPLTPQKEKRLKRKLYTSLLLLLIFTNLMLFVSDPPLLSAIERTTDIWYTRITD